jgi:hypothetical protein
LLKGEKKDEKKKNPAKLPDLVVFKKKQQSNTAHITIAYTEKSALIDTLAILHNSVF